MVLLTLARQATLGRNLGNVRDQAASRLALAKTYYHASSSTLALSDQEQQFHNFAYLAAAYSAVDGFLTDVSTEVLRCFPEKLKDSDIKLKEVLVGTQPLLDAALEQQVSSLSYQSFADMTAGVAKFFNSKTFAHPSIDAVMELKATRDIYIHNRGKINDVYLRKAGPNSRKPDPRGLLPLDASYLIAGTDAMIEFVAALYDHGPKTMEKFGKTKTFETMWKNTALERMVPFSEGWEIIDDNMVRPREKVLAWGWSTSEKYLLDFFLYVFGGKHPARTSEVWDALRRWPADTNEGQVILSWMDSPFQF